MTTDTAIALENGINFRDLGGLIMKNGRRIRSGCLFRSGALSSLSERDLIALSALPATAILDYRDASESTRHPDRLWAHARYFLSPANPLSTQVSASLDTLVNEAIHELDAEAFMLDLYRLLPFNNPAYHQLVHLLCNEEVQTLIQHCAVGKDRTGIGVALVLFALGADSETVMRDYMVTQQTLSPFRERMLTRFSHQLDACGLQKLAYVLSAHPDCMQAALDEIDTRYGSTDNWLAEEYQLDEAACQRLQGRFLEA
ncbi:tyrosine-protein phosphatase [Enterobacteriaceae bacterium LUAb1]